MHVCALIATMAIAAAAEQGAIESSALADVLRDLQRSVARDNRVAVSALMHYPLTVWAARVRIPVPDSAALLRNYDAIFSPALKAVIARAALPGAGEAASAVPVRVSGSVASVEDALTIERVRGQLKITSISVPMAPPDPGRPSSQQPEQPTRLVLGLRTVQRAGLLAEGERDSYVIWGDKNQLLEVRITGVQERAIVARIVSRKGEVPVDRRAGEGARTWIGRLPEGGEYLIDVVRLARGRQPLSYLLSIRLR